MCDSTAFNALGEEVTERLGGREYRQFHRGGSDHVNV